MYNDCMNGTAAAKPIFKDKKRRVWELDFLRGVAVIAMCFDHLMFDLQIQTTRSRWFANFKEVGNAFIEWSCASAYDYWYSTFRFWAHYIFVFLFLFLVGTSCAFSRDNTRRGALCGVAAIAFTGISFVCKAMGLMDDGVVFGILHCIALCILCCAAVDILTSFDKHVNLYAPLVLGFGILLAGILTQFWIVDWDRNGFVDSHFTGYVLGTHAFGDDWFGLFPYVGMVLLGMYWGKAVYSRRMSILPVLDKKWHKPFTFVGRHALWFYFFHQPVLAGLVIVLCLCLGYSM